MYVLDSRVVLLVFYILCGMGLRGSLGWHNMIGLPALLWIVGLEFFRIEIRRTLEHRRCEHADLFSS